MRAGPGLLAGALTLTLYSVEGISAQKVDRDPMGFLRV